MILVTGATGHVGRKAVRLLLAGGHTIAAMARSAKKAEQALPGGVPIRIADYDDRASMQRAFRGVASLLLVASDGDEETVTRHHANVIEAASAAAVGHILFTSITDVDETSPFYFAPAYRDAERRLRACGVEWTILRCGLYSDFILSNWLLPARSTGEVSLPLAAARIAPVSRDDVAEAAVAAIGSNIHRGKIHELTGPASYRFDEIVAIASRVFGIPIRYVSCRQDDYLRRARMELRDPWPYAFSTLCASI